MVQRSCQNTSGENFRQEKFKQNVLTEIFLHWARNCLHHISDRYFQQKMNKEIDTGTQKCKECGARRDNHRVPD